MANFMTKSIFDDDGMLEEHQKELGRLLSHPEGMITGDGCDFPKKGNSSVGVARQYCGPAGKVDNCQASVMVGYASPEGYGLADYALYMPEKWFYDKHAALREKCRVPENLEFATKNRMLLELISKAVSSGNFKGKYIGVDSFFGRDHDFLDSLPSGFVYFADVPSNHLVFEGRPEMVIPKYSGRGRKPDESPAFAPRKASDIAADPSIPWEEVVLGIGAKGPIIAKDKCLKVVEVRDKKPGNDIWLYVRQLEDGSVKYSLCNESMDAAHMMVRAPALMRWSIEQCFNECKKHLGMDHYEVRIWPAWRRHMLFTLIAHLFIIKLRRMFTAATNSPGPAPVVASPVSADEYRNAIIQAITPADNFDTNKSP
jgi:SRSO17 transposase